MARQKIHQNSKSHKILKYLLVSGGVAVISIFSPQSGTHLVHALLKHYLRKKRLERHRLLQDLTRLQSRKLIHYEELTDGKIKITLSKRGKQETLRYSLDDIKLDTTKPWDGVWRLVMFDIPHSKKQARDALREKLKELRFYPIQKSVFLTPYECEREIDFICSIFDIRNDLLLLYVKKFEGEEKFRHHFGV